MKPAILIGVLLIAVGAGGIVLDTFTYEEEETVFKLGDLEATTKEEKAIPLKEGGAIALAAGVVLIIAGALRRK